MRAQARLATKARLRWAAAKQGYMRREQALLNLQRFFKDYTHNIYLLNRAALKIQHWFFTALLRRAENTAPTTPRHGPLDYKRGYFIKPTMTATRAPRTPPPRSPPSMQSLKKEVMKKVTPPLTPRSPNATITTNNACELSFSEKVKLSQAYPVKRINSIVLESLKLGERAGVGKRKKLPPPQKQQKLPGSSSSPRPAAQDYSAYKKNKAYALRTFLKSAFRKIELQDLRAPPSRGCEKRKYSLYQEVMQQSKKKSKSKEPIKQAAPVSPRAYASTTSRTPKAVSKPFFFEKSFFQNPNPRNDDPAKVPKQASKVRQQPHSAKQQARQLVRQQMARQRQNSERLDELLREEVEQEGERGFDQEKFVRLHKAIDTPTFKEEERRRTKMKLKLANSCVLPGPPLDDSLSECYSTNPYSSIRGNNQQLQPGAGGGLGTGYDSLAAYSSLGLEESMAGPGSIEVKLYESGAGGLGEQDMRDYFSQKRGGGGGGGATAAGGGGASTTAWSLVQEFYQSGGGCGSGTGAVNEQLY